MLKPTIKNINEEIISYDKYTNIQGINDVVRRHIISADIEGWPCSLVSSISYILLSLYRCPRFNVDNEKIIITDKMILIEEVIKRLRSVHIAGNIDEGLEFSLKLLHNRESKTNPHFEVKSHDIRVKGKDADYIKKYINNVVLCTLTLGNEINLEGNIEFSNAIESDIYHHYVFRFERILEQYKDEKSIFYNKGKIRMYYIDNNPGKNIIRYALEYITTMLDSLVANAENNIYLNIDKYYIEVGNDTSKILGNMVFDLLYPHLSDNNCKVDISTFNDFTSRLTFTSFNTANAKADIISAVKKLDNYSALVKDMIKSI